MILNIHSHAVSPESIQSVDLASITSKINHYYSVGIHPWNTDSITLSDKEIIELLETNLSKKNCLALGECGLDKLRGANLNRQIQLFRLQINSAIKFNKPVIIHCVKAFNELIELRNELTTGTWISHGYRGKKELALSLQKHNIKVSFGTHLLLSEQVQESFCALENQNVFLETDEQAPSEIYKLMEHAAALKNVSLNTFRQILENNINQTFNLV